MSVTVEPASPEGEAAEPTEPSGNLISSAHLVAAGILLSRISGLVRDIVFASFLGTSGYASAFRGALRMPNVLQNLLGEGTLSASFIPVYSRLLEDGDEEAAGRLAGATFALLVAVGGGLALFGAVMAPILVDFFLPGFEGETREVAIICTRIIFPMTGILVMSAWALGILNSHRKFFVSYTAPVLWNAAMIATLLIFGTSMDQRGLVIALSWGALIGGALQFLVQVPWILRLQRRLKLNANFRTGHMSTVVRNAGPAVMGRGVVQLSGWADMFLASFLFPGALAALGYAQTFYMLPVSLFGMSIAASELPELSRAGAGEAEPLRRRVAAGLRQMAVFVVPSVVGYLVLGDLIVGAMYERNEFVRADTILVYLILAAYSIGLLASTATRLYSSAFFALHDTKTPAKTAVVRVLLSIVIGVTLMVMLEPITVPVLGMTIGRAEPVMLLGRPLGAVGLAAGAGIAAWIEWLILRRILRQRIGDAAPGAVLVKLFIAAGLAAAAARGVMLVLPELPLPVTLVIVMVPFGILYFGLANLLGVQEVSTALKRVAGRLGLGRK